MPYQSFFSGNSGGAPASSGGGYKSFFGTATIAKPTTRMPSPKASNQIDYSNASDVYAAAKNIKNYDVRDQAKIAQHAARLGILNKQDATDFIKASLGPTPQDYQLNLNPGQKAAQTVAGVAQTIAAPFAETAQRIGKQTKYLATSPTGGASETIKNQQLARSNPQFIQATKGIDLKNVGANELQQAEKMAAGGANAKDINAYLQKSSAAYKANTRQGAATAAAVATDVIGGGSLKGAKTASDVARRVLPTSVLGGVNTEASTLAQNPNVSKEELGKAGLEGMAAGAVLPVAGHVVGKGASKLLEETTAGQTALKNAKINKLLTIAEQPPKIKAEVDQKLVQAGHVSPKIEQTPMNELTLGHEAAGKKIDQAKVNQYVKQIQDGEPIQPVVVRKEGGKTTVIDGQHRMAAAQKLGINDVPTVEKISEAPIPTAAKETEAAQAKTPAEVTPTTPETHSIKVFGKEIPMTKENGFKATPTKDGGVVYQKTAMRGNNAKGDRQAITHYYTSDGKNITKTQHDSMVAKPQAAPKISTRKQTEYKPGGPEPVVVPIKEKVPELPTQEIKTSGGALNAEAKAVQKGLVTDLGEKAQYGAGSFKHEATKAVDLVKNDPQKALDIATGKTPGDNTIHEVAVSRALENKALKEGDVETLRQLAKSPRHAVTSEAAQRLGAEGYGEKDSVVKSMAKLQKVRQDAFEKKTGKTATKAVSDEVKAIRAAKPKVTVQSWSEFVDSIKC